MSSLVSHAKVELTKAGMFDDDSDYNGELGKSVLELIEVFANQGHSGMSAEICIEMFTKLAKFENLS